MSYDFERQLQEVFEHQAVDLASKAEAVYHGCRKMMVCHIAKCLWQTTLSTCTHAVAVADDYADFHWECQVIVPKHTQVLKTLRDHD